MFNPPGSHVCSSAIQTSSVLRRMFVVCDVGVMTVTLTMWLFDVKWRDTGLKIISRPDVRYMSAYAYVN